ncbi:LysR family transcriptional regulator [Yinghuangia sp. YIM S09857]|uniref:LysR family transcriptional regulator n=1 Tax=Yinghuangia sp. YIM S09857 TaxID=3436929 RepID=UPI003F52DCF8
MNLIAHLTCFVAVAEELHFGRAAQRLGMAQPQLSQRLKRLEGELGVRLVDRSSRHVGLTEPGRRLLDEAHEILARVRRVYALAEGSPETGTLRAGVPGEVGAGTVAALIGAFQERRPGTVLDLRPLGTAAQVRGLAEGTLDVGILRHPAETHGLVLGPIVAEPLGVLLPASSPWADAPEVHLSDLAGSEFAVFAREEAPEAYDELLADCRRHGYHPAAVHDSPNPDFTLGLVLAGRAVALLPHTVPPPGLTWRPLLGRPLLTRLSCAWRRGADEAGPVGDFAEAVADVLRERAAAAPAGPAIRPRRVVRPASAFLA